MLGQLPRSPGASSVANTSLCSLCEDVFISSLPHILLAKCAISFPLGTCILNYKRSPIWKKPPGIPELSLTREIPVKPRPENVQTPGKAVGFPRPHGHGSGSGSAGAQARWAVKWVLAGSKVTALPFSAKGRPAFFSSRCSSSLL